MISNHDLYQWIAICVVAILNVLMWYSKLYISGYLSSGFLIRNDVIKDYLELVRVKKIERFREDETLLKELWSKLYECICAWNDFLSKADKYECVDSVFYKHYEALDEYLSAHQPFIPKVLFDAIDHIIAVLDQKRKKQEYGYSFEKELGRVYSIYRVLLDI
jgi:hypothetical protein